MARRAQEAPVTEQGGPRLRPHALRRRADEKPDKQGRITIPPMLREYAALSKDVVVIGVMNRVEIWDPARWQEYSAAGEPAFSELSEEVFPGV